MHTFGGVRSGNRIAGDSRGTVASESLVLWGFVGVVGLAGLGLFGTAAHDALAGDGGSATEVSVGPQAAVAPPEGGGPVVMGDPQAAGSGGGDFGFGSGTVPDPHAGDSTGGDCGWNPVCHAGEFAQGPLGKIGDIASSVGGIGGPVGWIRDRAGVVAGFVGDRLGDLYNAADWVTSRLRDFGTDLLIPLIDFGGTLFDRIPFVPNLYSEFVRDGVHDGIWWLQDRTPHLLCPISPFGCADQAGDLPEVGDGELRVIGYNSANGASEDKYRTAAARDELADFINESGAGIIALQEVHHDSNRTTGNDQDINTAVDAYARAVCGGDVACIDDFNDADRRTTLENGATIIETPEGTVVFGAANSDGYGNATIVADPNERVTSVENISLNVENAENDGNCDGRECRSALVTRTENTETGRQLSTINVHFSKNDEAHADQLADVARIVAAERARGNDVVLAGDFNTHKPATAAALSAAGLDHAAGTGIDQVWVSSGTDVSHAAEVNAGDSSDHDRSATVTLGG